MEPIKVSVCMVTYNHERYIAQAVESALEQQTTFPYEIVIGEDCSTDRTRAIVEELGRRHPEKIQLRLATRNQGAKANFVDVFGQCRGEYVVILEGDDYFINPEKLQRQADLLDARRDWAICFHPARCEYEDGSEGPALLPDNWQRAEATIADLFPMNFIPTSGAMFRNRLTPVLPPWFHETKLGDWPLHILNAAHGNIGFLPEVMSVYRIHPNGMWTSQSLEEKLASIFEMLTAVDHHFDGRYAKEIEQNRLTTVRWLAGQWNHVRRIPERLAELEQKTELAAKQQHQELTEFEQKYELLAEECRTLAKESRLLDEDYRRLVEDHRTLEQLHGALAQAHRLLGDENRRLQADVDAWHRTLTYRVSREAQRPWKQLWALVQRHRQPPLAPPREEDPPAAKAA